MNKYDADSRINRIHNAFSPLNDSVTPPLEISPFMIERGLEKTHSHKRKIGKTRIVAAALTLVIALGAAVAGLKFYSDRMNDGQGLGNKAEQTTAIGTTAAKSNIAATAAATAAASTAANNDNTAISAATSTIIDRLNNLYSKHKTYIKKGMLAAENGADVDALDTEQSYGGGPDEHSETNVQEQGVNEGDTVITDGEYIYKIRVDEIYGKSYKDNYTMNYIEIINAKTMKKCAQIKEKSKYRYFAEMYLSDNLLTLLEYEVVNGEINSDISTVVRIYDVSNKTAPKLRSEYTVSGNLESSRMVDGVLYIVTHDYINVDERVTKKNLNSFLPTVKSNGDVKSCAVKDIYCIGNDDSNSFISFTALNTKDKSAKMNIKSLLCDGFCDVYYTKNSAYLFETIYDYDESGDEEKCRTEFMKLNLSGDKIYADCKFSVEGSVYDRLYMSEHDGYFRVVSTEYTYKSDTRSSQSGVYVFDKDGKKVGSITGLGKNEDVYSVRFEGDICYFVTYETKDPLFAVDLSNPTKPTLISKLESPGYSTFLYRVKGYLVGVGNNDNSEPKISLFSKDGKTELDTVQLADTLQGIMKVKGADTKYGVYDEYQLYNVYSPAVFDFHSFCANEKSGDILIPFNVSGEIGSELIEKTGLAVYTVAGEKLKVKKVLVSRNNDEDSYDIRTLYIGNYYYYIDDDCLVRYDSANDYAKVMLNF
ncbi:MAG: beta-propeller domain-containing protein [Acutalibacteraceae bacterium]